MKELRVVTSIDLVDRGSALSQALILSIPSVLYKAVQRDVQDLNLDNFSLTLVGDVFRRGAVQNTDLKNAFERASLISISTRGREAKTVLVRVEFRREGKTFWSVDLSVDGSTIRYIGGGGYQSASHQSAPINRDLPIAV